MSLGKKKKAEDVGQDNFLNIVEAPILRDETKDKKATGGHISRSKPAERTQHEIWKSSLIQPIHPRGGDGSWTNT